MRPVTLLALVTMATAVAPITSKWVTLGADHKLHYQTTPQGDRIMDFSHVGYGGGGVDLPSPRVLRTLHAAPGDNTRAIQTALDDAAKASPAAVLLAPGAYDIEGTLTLANSGIVLRGSGNDTTLRLTGVPHRLLEIRGSGAWQEDGCDLNRPVAAVGSIRWPPPNQNRAIACRRTTDTDYRRKHPL